MVLLINFQKRNESKSNSIEMKFRNRWVFCISCLIFIYCQNHSERNPKKKDLILFAALYTYQKTQSTDCKDQYKYLNSLYATYASATFSSYSTQCDAIILGDSTMDLARATSFYDATKTLNYAISGNTACDYFYQIENIRCNPKNVLIATGDGNGVLRKVSSANSIETMRKVIAKIKGKWNANIVVIGIHPILLPSENSLKNPVNQGVSQLGVCYINPLPIFGVGENDPPDSSLMIDSIHYNPTIYPKYKTQITS
ncbi:MAG TPA: hypothetical protein PKD50_11610, partial [Leptospiraceae bacterium]|nr:hypothetical protein [Leptospiraceae bacterium]